MPEQNELPAPLMMRTFALPRVSWSASIRAWRASALSALRLCGRFRVMRVMFSSISLTRIVGSDVVGADSVIGQQLHSLVDTSVPPPCLEAQGSSRRGSDLDDSLCTKVIDFFSGEAQPFQNIH